MGTLCIAGVDDNPVLKDFVRAHVEMLQGEKVIVGHRDWDWSHEGRMIRHFYSSRPVRRKLRGLLPSAVHRRVAETEKAVIDDRADAMHAFFRRHDVSVILAEFGTVGADILPFAQAAGIPLVVHFHGHDAHRTVVVEAYRARYREMFAYAARILTVSRFMTDTLVAMGAHRDRIVYNPYGPRERFFDITPAYPATVLSLGRFTDIKANYLTLIAFRRALESVPDARMVMAGDGELLETCRTLARAWGIADRVTFPGAVRHAEITPLFENACCFAQHSVTPSYGDAEGTPVAILEAGAAGLPVISTLHAGIPDVVVDGVTGFLAGERDVESMAANMVRCLENPEMCRSMGAAARAHVRSNLSLAAHIARLQQAIEEARARQ
jgi:glycosyltransferase involved in cell wall biosynthesis